ncbi:hypothetical protein B9Z39_02470 [Limnohabitans sp. JirII-29]|uniref:calcium-binding protein n=1 Tax=Limnohabitans sp. JirII-29 TaxID=1835756 RepID=UPI000D3C14B3|nr:calcium-binding protein [Limnohabitans sp. JirII-29]PUE30396.1 hypothetical protein B9Z39_02470 [Limnohabitans sp. JirII-29]
MTTYSFTIYITGAGTAMQGGGTSNAGHMWYSLNSSAGETGSYGFAPKDVKDTGLPVLGRIVDDDISSYINPAYSKTMTLTETEYNRLKEFGDFPFAHGFDSTYWAPTNSCVDFVWKALEFAGFNPSMHQGSLLPLDNRDDLQRFMNLPQGEQLQLTKWLTELFPVTGISWTNESYETLITQLQTSFKLAEVTMSPLVLDLDGDGVETTTSSKTGVHFDLDKSGFAEQAGWVGKDDGLLVRDLNGDGKITHGGELFGNHTVLKSGSQVANGFEALKDLDDNNDGKVDANDSAYASLRVWKDLNSDGVTEDGELITLEQAGVQSLNVRYTDQGTGATKDAQGNQHQQLGSYTKADGSTQQMDDVWFSVDTAHTVNLNTVTVSDEIAALPDVAGMGNLCSLHQAMARDESGQLKALVAQWQSSSDKTQDAVLDNLIYHWAGVQDVDPSSRGVYFGDARKLEVVEMMAGKEYFQMGWWSDPEPDASVVLLSIYDQVKAYTLQTLYWQTDAQPLLENLSLQWVEADPTAEVGSAAASAHFVWDVSALTEALYERFATEELNQAAQEFLCFQQGLKDHGGDELVNALRSQASQYTDKDNPFFALLLRSPSEELKTGTSLADTLIANDSNATVLLGFSGNDHLYGASKDDVLDGGEGNDSLDAGNGNDTLTGGTGADTLYGSYGNDTYVFNQGDSADTIYDYDYTAGNIDTLQLGAGLLAGDVTVGRVSNDLKLSWGTDSVTIQNYFSGTYYQVEKISFADGTTWGVADVAGKLTQNGTAYADYMYGLNDYANRMNGLGGNDYISGGGKDDVLDGGEGNDVLDSGYGNDTLTGGTGNDALYGGYGNDTYVFNQGDSADTIYDYDYTAGNIDTLQLGAGLLAGDVTVGRVSNDLTLSWGTDSVTVLKYFSSTYYQVEKISFADGTTWGVADVAGKLTQNGTAYADYMYGLNDYANRMNGLGGNDYLYGGNQDDVMNGGEGNDSLDAGNGNDTLTGGTGADTLYGGYGNDTYVFNQGDGADTIYDVEYTAGNVDTLQLGAALLVTDTTLDRIGSDLKLSWGADTVTVQNYFSGTYYQVEKISFADGTTWGMVDVAGKLTQNGTAYADYMYGLNDYANRMNGLGGNDMLLGGNQDDVLDGGEGSDYMLGYVGNDTYTIDSETDVVYEDYNQGTDTVLSSVSCTLASNCENLSLTGVTAINGVGNSLNNVLVGNAAANTLTGGTGADQFVFNTALSGTNVDTITDFSRSEGDVIALSSVVFTKLQGKVNLSSYFRLSTQTPQDDDDYLVYNSTTGQLAYDATGNASAAAVVFATLINKPQDFTAAQMVVI